MISSSADMASNFQSPDPRKTLSARVKMSIHAKLGRIRELWQEQARLKGLDPDLVKEIDTTYVLERILNKACDDELAQWGGYPESEAQLENTLRRLREANAAVASSTKKSAK